MRTIKTYITDIDRIKRLSYKDLKKYRDAHFRKIVNYAYSVPMYRKKYKKAGIHPDKISGLDDIEKLPFITKKDIRKNFPDGIIPSDFDRDKGFLVSTSGSTGKPVSLYRDHYAIIHDLWGFIRELRSYGIRWSKHRICLLSDLAPNSVGNAYMTFNTKKSKKAPLLSFNNIKTIDINKKVEDILDEVNLFKPDFLSGYPDILQGLAVLKRKGYGKNIKPKCIQSSGAVLSDYMRRYIEDTFNCKVFDTYSSTEAGPAVFECGKGNYHIHSDFVHLEFMDKNKQPVKTGKPGHIVVTRLHCGGTPIIRYTGNDDIMTPLDKKCNCGINSSLIRNIGGRTIDTFILPDGKIMPPLSVTGIPNKIMKEYKTDKIKQFQIIQREKDRIDVLIVIDEELRNDPPSVDKILEKIKKSYEEKFGEAVKVNAEEVEEVEKSEENGVVKEVISEIDHEDILNI